MRQLQLHCLLHKQIQKMHHGSKGQFFFSHIVKEVSVTDISHPNNDSWTWSLSIRWLCHL